MWEEQADNINNIKINKEYAAKFERRKKMEELEKAKVKYGKNLDGKKINLLE
jgi:hypothetical protein